MLMDVFYDSLAISHSNKYISLCVILYLYLDVCRVGNRFNLQSYFLILQETCIVIAKARLAPFVINIDRPSK